MSLWSDGMTYVFYVAHLDAMKFLDLQQQQCLMSQREKGNEWCLLDRMINVTFIK